MEEKPLDADEDEAVVEEETEKEPASPKMKKVMVGQWEHLNSQPPLWMRYVVTLALVRTPLTFLPAIRRQSVMKNMSYCTRQPSRTSKNLSHGTTSMVTRNPAYLSVPSFTFLRGCE